MIDNQHDNHYNILKTYNYKLKYNWWNVHRNQILKYLFIKNDNYDRFNIHKFMLLCYFYIW